MEEIKKICEGIAKEFETFKETNDERLAKLEKNKGVADVEEKLAKIDTKLNELDEIKQVKERVEELEAKADTVGGATSTGGLSEQHKKAFCEFVAKGASKEEALAEIQSKAVNITTAGDGGYALPEDLNATLIQQKAEISPFRQLAKVEKVATNDVKRNVDTRGFASGWVDEDDARSETNSATIAQVTINMGELYAAPQATQTALDDLLITGGVENWILGSLKTQFSKAENAAFVAGTGTKQPKGITAYTTAATADSSRTFGQLEHVLSGSSGAIVADNFFDIIYKMKPEFLSKAAFMMRRATLATARKFKDQNDNYLWQPGLAAGQPSTLVGYPVYAAEDIPAVAGGALCVAFGDFESGYLICDHIVGTRVLRDPYTAKPEVVFYVTQRVGGAVTDSDAIKFIKCTA